MSVLSCKICVLLLNHAEMEANRSEVQSVMGTLHYHIFLHRQQWNKNVILKCRDTSVQVELMHSNLDLVFLSNVA